MKKVVIGISGGVDSSVAAYLLKKDCYEVIGVTFVFTDDFDTTDATLVCNELGIKHYIIDYKEEFRKMIINRFISDYNNGLTPNPCVICNKEVKLKFLYDQMQKLNCDFIATGHYAKFENNKLYRGSDVSKDQSYFLCEVPRNILSKTLFPLEQMEKTNVRDIALNAHITVANKKDSTDVCFIKNGFNNFAKEFIDNREGDVVDISSNTIIGKHLGLSLYTIGQRKGLNIGGNDERLFVVGKNIKNNILYVAKGTENKYLISNSCLIKDVNLISYHHPTFCTAKFRYRSKEVAVELEYLENNKILVKYPSGVSSVTPGQICALYLGSECIGGGTIEEIMYDNKKIEYVF